MSYEAITMEGYLRGCLQVSRVLEFRASDSEIHHFFIPKENFDQYDMDDLNDIENLHTVTIRELKKPVVIDWAGFTCTHELISCQRKFEEIDWAAKQAKAEESYPDYNNLEHIGESLLPSACNIGDTLDNVVRPLSQLTFLEEIFAGKFGEKIRDAAYDSAELMEEYSDLVDLTKRQLVHLIDAAHEVKYTSLCVASALGSITQPGLPRSTVQQYWLEEVKHLEEVMTHFTDEDYIEQAFFKDRLIRAQNEVRNFQGLQQLKDVVKDGEQ